jgi:hypothetical protein
MLSHTRLTFYTEFSVFWLRFFPQFWLILHLLDPDPDPGSQWNADPDQKHCHQAMVFIKERHDTLLLKATFCQKTKGDDIQSRTELCTLRQPTHKERPSAL